MYDTKGVSNLRRGTFYECFETARRCTPSGILLQARQSRIYIPLVGVSLVCIHSTAYRCVRHVVRMFVVEEQKGFASALLLRDDDTRGPRPQRNLKTKQIVWEHLPTYST
jgi:hypothetical protein